MTERHLKGGAEAPTGCPCGRDHKGPCRSRVWRKPSETLPTKVMEAQWAGKASQDAKTKIWQVEYSGDCKSPLSVRQHALSPDLRARYKVRCRKCGPCRRAMRNYWGYAAMEQTRQAAALGGRTWFGTLELSPDWYSEMLVRAMKRTKVPAVDFQTKEPVEYYCKRRKKIIKTERLVCAAAYNELCRVMLHEVQKYWKRLRNAGHSFKYIAVFEPHKSGKPHCHFLLHELKGDKVLKRELRSAWPCGFFQAKLVGAGREADKPAWYVVKYLSKTVQTRIRASRHYRPEKRAKPQSPKDVL